MSILYTRDSGIANVLFWISLVAYSSEMGWSRGTFVVLESCLAYACLTVIKIEISGEIS